MKRRFLADEAATLALGESLAHGCQGGMILFLRGDLGAGKTTLARGFLRGSGHPGTVKSPTYTLVEPYELPGRTVFHFDLYRLHDPEELEYLGMRDYLSETAVCLIEWPERGAAFLPPPDLEVELQHRAQGGRRAVLCARSARGRRLLSELWPDGDSNP